MYLQYMVGMHLTTKKCGIHVSNQQNRVLHPQNGEHSIFTIKFCISGKKYMKHVKQVLNKHETSIFDGCPKKCRKVCGCASVPPLHNSLRQQGDQHDHWSRPPCRHPWYYGTERRRAPGTGSGGDHWGYGMEMKLINGEMPIMVTWGSNLW